MHGSIIYIFFVNKMKLKLWKLEKEKNCLSTYSRIKLFSAINGYQSVYFIAYN